MTTRRTSARRRTAEQRQQIQQTNRSGCDDVYTEGNVLEVGRDEQGPFLVIANRDGRVTVRLRCRSECPSVRPGDYVRLEGTKENEQLFYADEVSIARR